MCTDYLGSLLDNGELEQTPESLQVHFSTSDWEKRSVPENMGESVLYPSLLSPGFSNFILLRQANADLGCTVQLHQRCQDQ